MEAQLLILTAAGIAFLHTVLGPDHYLVFTALGKARGWTLRKTLTVTALCGLGHIAGSILLGIVGLLLGSQLATLVGIEGVRGDLASWALMAFGLCYLAWGLRQAGRKHTHSHVHSHGDLVHSHPHDHQLDHAHVHDEKSTITPWALFIIFVLGPCEALIPLFMYPAAESSTVLVFAVATVFGVVTLLTMLAGVVLTSLALSPLRWRGAERYGHAIAGGSIAACAAGMTFLGL